MEHTGNTILVTGGSNGIGLAFARRWLQADNEVIVCGRRESKLREAQKKYPGLKTRVCDVGDPAERVALCEWATREFPRLNVLVNNAGIQRRVQLAEQEDWQATRDEIAINLDAPIHLSRLFIPHLRHQARAAIVNVSSGLAFVPKATVPVYCSTKAALHSFTLSLRYQLRSTPIEVIEVLPPAVDTDLGGPGLHTFGVNVDEFADNVFQRLGKGETGIAYGFAQSASQATRAEQEAIFRQMNPES